MRNSNTNLNQQAPVKSSKNEDQKNNKKKLKMGWIIVKLFIRIGLFLWKFLEVFTNDA